MMRKVGAFSGTVLASAESMPSLGPVIQPTSIRSASGNRRWLAGRFMITVPLARMRVPSKNEASPSLSQPEALVASETNWWAASWNRVPVMPSNPPPPM